MDIQFRKYASNQNGQAIQIAATGVTIQNVILNQNGGSSMYTPLYIGANSTVSVHGGALTLTNCRFEGNESDRGEDIYCKSGSITATYGEIITRTNCDTPTDQYSSGTFTNNGGASPAFTTPTVPTFTGTCGGSNVVLPIECFSLKLLN